jgi:Uma2 family endonuclease
MRNKAEAYLTFGTRIVWLVFPEDQTIEVYLPDEDVKTLTVEDTLEGGEILPGFTLSVHDVFAV